MFKRTPPKVTRAPHIPMLTEDNVRTGFLEHHQALKLRDALPSHLQGFFWFGYSTGWRINEIRNLTDRNFDEVGRTIRLFPGTTKNKEGRVLYLDDDLFSIIHSQRAKRPEGCKYLFYTPTGGPVKDIRGSWAKACKAAGVPGLLFHDLRRTSVRNSVRAGVPEKIAMALSGHKTRAVFDRYNIVSDADLREATQRKEAYLKGKENGLLHNLLQLDDFHKNANG